MGLLARIKEDPLYQDLNWRLILIGIISSLGALGFGFDNGWSDGVLGPSSNASTAPLTMSSAAT
jgi:MFS transporter, SP family, sugar:H+ symporter